MKKLFALSICALIVSTAAICNAQVLPPEQQTPAPKPISPTIVIPADRLAELAKAFAPVPPSTNAPAVESTAEVGAATQLLISILLEKYGTGTKAGVLLALLIGALRLIVKPIVSSYEAKVRASPSLDDDAALARAHAHPAGKVFFFLLDLIASYKPVPTLQGHIAAAARVTAPVVVALLLVGCVGCASQKTSLSETIHADGSSSKETKVYTRTFFDSKTALAKLKTSSTEKTQSVGISDLSQESSGSNAVNVISAVTEAAIKAVLPKP